MYRMENIWNTAGYKLVHKHQHERKNKSLFQRLQDSVLSSPKDADEGKRKLLFSIYILHRMWFMGLAGIILYMVMRRWMHFEHKEVTDILGMVGYFLVATSSSALGIYAAGDVGEWKYRSGNNGFSGGLGNGFGGLGNGNSLIAGGDGKNVVVNVGNKNPSTDGVGPDIFAGVKNLNSGVPPLSGKHQLPVKKDNF